MSAADLLQRLSGLEAEHRELEARLGDPTLASDNARYVKVMRRYRELTKLVEVGARLRERLDDAETAEMLMEEADADERDELRQEAAAASAEVEELEAELRILLLPPDPNAGRDVIIEIRGAEGGEEANLFARDLFEMYQGYAAQRGWTSQVLGSDPSDLGGFNDVTFSLAGDDVWTLMKFEAGPHRVQRVPVTESQGRIHTSSATVTVLPQADEVEVDIDANDIQVDTFRSSGAGGQHVNTTDSAVRLTHLPTGLVVSMQDEKSQLQNRARAMVVLRSRLLQLEQDKQAAEASDARRSQIGGGGRSEKIRTYNFKENRLTDHRIGLTLYKLDRVLAGDLGDVSDALVLDERTRQLSEHED
ncbi:MAG: peptide chain release factor 1 [Acidimicrobiales bacterium]